MNLPATQWTTLYIKLRRASIGSGLGTSIASIRETLRQGLSAAVGIPVFAPIVEPLESYLRLPVVNVVENMSTLVLAAAVPAILIAVAGVYGLVSVDAAERAREFGVRRAFGADTRNLLWLALRGPCEVWVGGSVVGIGAGYAAITVLRALIVGLGPPSLFVGIGAAGILLFGICVAIGPASLTLARSGSLRDLVG
jgi:ABC-type antimicrobial peptide transport system permease subunit